MPKLTLTDCDGKAGTGFLLIFTIGLSDLVLGRKRRTDTPSAWLEARSSFFLL